MSQAGHFAGSNEGAFALSIRSTAALASLTFLVFTAVSGARAQMPPGAAAGPVEVGVVTLHPQAVPVTMELAGRATASQVVEVRPQVGGIIKAIDFKDGAQVKAGDRALRDR